MLESSLVKYGEKVVSCSRGNPCSVIFDWDSIWAFSKSCENFNPMSLRFFHTHPHGSVNYSTIDENCLKGWTISFNFPVLFYIISFINSDLENFEYQYSAYTIENGKMVSHRYSPQLRSTDLAMLKSISCAYEER